MSSSSSAANEKPKPSLPPKPVPNPKKAAELKDFEALWAAYVIYMTGSEPVTVVSLQSGFTSSRLGSFVVRFGLVDREPKKSSGIGTFRRLHSSTRKKSRNDKYGSDSTSPIF